MKYEADITHESADVVCAPFSDAGFKSMMVVPWNPMREDRQLKARR